MLHTAVECARHHRGHSSREQTSLTLRPRSSDVLGNCLEGGFDEVVCRHVGDECARVALVCAQSQRDGRLPTWSSLERCEIRWLHVLHITKIRLLPQQRAIARQSSCARPPSTSHGVTAAAFYPASASLLEAVLPRHGWLVRRAVTKLCCYWIAALGRSPPPRHPVCDVRLQCAPDHGELHPAVPPQTVIAAVGSGRQQ